MSMKDVRNAMDEALERRRGFPFDDCPFRIGDLVVVNPTCTYAADHPGEWRIVGMRWEYRQQINGRPGNWLNISIASEEEIRRGHAETDGWSATDFLPAI